MALLKRSRGLTVRQRFDGKWVLGDGGCWLWTDEPAGNGYGYLGVGGRAGRKIQAHRLAYEFYVGPIPEGYTIDHLCHNRDATCLGGSNCLHRRCVNPEHLEAVTKGVNLHRSQLTVTAQHAAKTECDRGHQLPPYVPGKKRQCRQCANDNRNARRAMQRRQTSRF